MTVEECLAQYGLTMDDWEPEEQKDVLMAHSKGRSAAKKRAIDHLFIQMGGARGGKDACMEYLARFGVKWDESPAGPVEFSMNFNKKK